MKRNRIWVTLTVALLGIAATGCTKESTASEPEAPPASIETVEGSDTSRIVLTEKAAARLAMETAAVEQQGEHLAIPYAAVMYHPAGDAFTYVEVEPLTYVNVPIVVDHIEGDLALLSEGPEAGAKVVAVGGAELFGAETGLGM